MRSAAAIVCCSIAGLVAQTAPSGDNRKYQNAGKPVQIDFQCTDEDIQWGGMSCTEREPCPVYLEIAGVEAVGSRLIAAGNLHSATMTLYSVLLTSEDDGKTWTEPFDRLRGAGLEHIQFVGFQNGWIGGQLLHPIPTDPFFLITSDGGKRWERRPIFSDGRPGAILQFSFDSKSTGVVVVDRGQSSEGPRYETYETRSGGEGWNIREAGDRPPAARRGADSVLRLRADGKLKAFVIERQTGGKWNPAAAFLISLPACKPAERKEVAPPEEPAAPAPAPAPPRTAKPPSLKRPPQ